MTNRASSHSSMSYRGVQQPRSRPVTPEVIAYSRTSCRVSWKSLAGCTSEISVRPRPECPEFLRSCHANLAPVPALPYRGCFRGAEPCSNKHVLRRRRENISCGPSMMNSSDSNAKREPFGDPNATSARHYWDCPCLATACHQFKARSEIRYWLCVPKTKSERIDDEVRPRWRANLWHRIAEPDERPAHPFAKTDAF